MNLFDLLFVNIIVICLFRGLYRGVIKEFFSIIGILCGFYLASKHYQILTVPLSDLTLTASQKHMLSFIIVFLVISILISLAGLIIAKVSKIEIQKFVDHSFGILFGFIKGVLIASVLLVVLTAFLSKGAPVIRNSDLSPHVISISGKMAVFISKNMQRNFFAKRSVLEEYWD